MAHEKSCFGETCIGNLKLLFTVITGGDIRALRTPIDRVDMRAEEGREEQAQTRSCFHMLYPTLTSSS